MQVNFHEYKIAALRSKLLSRKQEFLKLLHILSGFTAQELNTLSFPPFSDSQGLDSSQEHLLSTWQGPQEVLGWRQPGQALWLRWHGALPSATAELVLPFTQLWQQTRAGPHQAHQHKCNLTTSFQQPHVDWAHPDLMSWGKGIFCLPTFRLEFMGPHSSLMSVWSPFPFAFIDSGLRVYSFATTET